MKRDVCSQFKPLNEGEPIRVAFIFQDPTLWPAWESVYLALSADRRFTVRIFRTDKAEFSYALQTEFLNNQDISFCVYSEEALDFFAPHYCFLQTPYDYLGRTTDLYSIRLKLKGIRVVYIPYGVEIVDTPSARQEHFRSPVIENAFRIYVLSHDLAKEYQRYCPNFRAVRPLGLPRFDALLDKKRFALPSEIATRAAKRKTIVWHVHFTKVSFLAGQNRQITPYLEEYKRFAHMLGQFPECFFVFLPHPKFGNDFSDPASNASSREIMAIISQHENAYIDASADYRPTFLNADAIITDRSSLMVEAAVCNVPVLLLSNPDYHEDVIRPLRPLIESYTQGTGCADMADFVSGLERISSAPVQEALKVCIPFWDGHCAERIVEDLYQAIQPSACRPAPRHAPRIIVFGTGLLYKSVFENNDLCGKVDVIALSDNDASKWGTTIDGHPVIAPEEIGGLDFDKIIIMVNSLPGEHVYRQLRFDLEIPYNKIEFCDYLAMV